MPKRTLETSTKFAKKYRKADSRKQDLISAALQKFINYEDDALRIHKLQGKYSGFWSIDADYDLRIIYSINRAGTVIIHNLEDFGTHKQLYGK